MTIEDVIKKSILPLAFMVFWFWMTKTIMKVSGQTDWFWWIFIAGLPFGIHKMRLILIPRGMDTTATLGMAALSVIIGALIGSIMIVLEVKKLNHSFGETIVAKDINFQCHQGEVIALIGPNGTGKSTIGRILAGLLKEKSGEVVLFGKHCRPKGRLGKVWYIPQDLDSQLFGEDLLDELTTGAEVSPERKQAAEEILEALELMPFIKQHPSTLSGGQKQRLALGVALMHEAPIIILDEPTSGLDGTNMRNVSRMIRKLAKMGRTIIVITHDAECALACCERAIRLENGCITDDFQIRGAELLLEKIGYNQSSISGL